MLKMYSILRNDIEMSTGKLCSQSSHAYLGSFLTAQQSSPTAAGLYAADLPGTKVCLQAGLSHLLRAKQELEQADIPVFLVVDSGCANFFDGRPTITALGFGPATRSQLPKFINRLQLL